LVVRGNVVLGRALLFDSFYNICSGRGVYRKGIIVYPAYFLLLGSSKRIIISIEDWARVVSLRELSGDRQNVSVG
jgi:hypothetical protein